MHQVKIVRLERTDSADVAIVRKDEIVLVVEGVHFTFTEEDINNHLAVGYMEDESVHIQNDGYDVVLELFPRDYRLMLSIIRTFGKVAGEQLPYIGTTPRDWDNINKKL